MHDSNRSTGLSIINGNKKERSTRISERVESFVGGGRTGGFSHNEG